MRDLWVGTDNGVEGLPHVRGPVLCLARANGTVWAVAEDGAAVASGDRTIRVRDTKATCIASSPGAELWIGTAGARLLRARDGGAEPVTSFDAAPGRDGWYTPWGGPPDVRSIAVGGSGGEPPIHDDGRGPRVSGGPPDRKGGSGGEPPIHDDGRGPRVSGGPPERTGNGVFVNVHVGGIVASDDETKSWHTTIDVDSDVHQVIVDGDRLLAATAIGLASSGDAGVTWTFETEGLHAVYCRAVAVAGGTVLLSASEGPHGGRAAIYRRAGGGPFVRCSEFFKGNIDTFCLVAEGSQCAFGTERGEVFVSADAGESWEKARGGPGRVRCLLV